MIGIAILLALIAVPVAAADYLVAIDADYREVRGQVWLEQAEVLSIGRDHLVARVEGSALATLPAHVILDRGERGAIEAGNYLSVQLRNATGRATATQLGTVLFERDGRLLIRRAAEIPDDLRLDGLDTVVPLRRLQLSPVAPAPPPRSMREDVIPDMVEAINQADYMEAILDLEDFFTRNARTVAFHEACTFAHDQFESYGISAEIEQFVATPAYGSSFVCWNVVAEKPGLLFPDQSYIVCGHLDATVGSPSQPEPEAPGADDDGSGAAAVLEIARVLSAYDFNYTLRFICFGAEEQGLCGSETYAFAAAGANDDILGVINLDMLLYGPYGHDTLQIVHNNQSQPLALTFDNMAGLYVPDLNVGLVYDPSHMYSDHYPFWVSGYHAVGGFEEHIHHNPYYHTAADVLSQYLIYFPFGTNCVRGAIATFAALGQPSTGIGIGEEVADSAPGLAGVSIATLSPNPVQEMVRVGISSAIDRWVRMTVYDVNGRAVLEQEARPISNGLSQLNLEVAGLPNGVYMLCADGDRSSATRKLVIAR